jgi:hypothetical protein
VRIGVEHRESLANRVTDHVKAVFNYAIKLDLFACANPARGCDKFKEKKAD